MNYQGLNSCKGNTTIENSQKLMVGEFQGYIAGLDWQHRENRRMHFSPLANTGCCNVFPQHAAFMELHLHHTF